MNEEELFCKLFPDYVYKGKPLSPYIDFFAIGYKQAENRCEELEKEITHLKELLLELYDCIPSSMADSCRETLQKIALVFKED